MKRLPLAILATACLCSACSQQQNPVAPAPAAAAQSSGQQRQAFIERIAALPAYIVHEESPENFRQRLHQGEYFCTGGKNYLHISGDGTFGRRVFIGLADGTLKVNILDGLKYKLLRYNEVEQTLEHEPTTEMQHADINPGYLFP